MSYYVLHTCVCVQVCVLALVCKWVCEHDTPPVVFILSMWYSALTSLILIFFFKIHSTVDEDSLEVEGNFRPFYSLDLSKNQV